MFGDESTYAMSESQLLAYVNRFGPGMVIYWFDFCEDSVGARAAADDILVVNHLPEMTSALS